MNGGLLPAREEKNKKKFHRLETDAGAGLADLQKKARQDQQGHIFLQAALDGFQRLVEVIFNRGRRQVHIGGDLGVFEILLPT